MCRYKTIFVFSIIYLAGIIMLTLSSMMPGPEDADEKAYPLQFAVL
jgi:hypothetical protein